MTRRSISDGRFAPPPAVFPRTQTRKEPWDKSPPPLQGWWNVLATWSPAIIACAGLVWEALKITGRL